MRFFSLFLRQLSDFLFPASDGVLALESLSPEELLATVPSSHYREEDSLVLFDYAHPLAKKIVWEIKYAGNWDLADKLGGILFDVLESELSERQVFERFEKVLLIPMPISDRRRMERGWNQAELLAEALIRRDHAKRYEYWPRELKKLRHTESQTRTADKRERLENLKDSMRVSNPEKIKGRFIVLLDDVITTGATMNEARRSLKEAGAKKIFSIAVAH